MQHLWPIEIDILERILLRFSTSVVLEFGLFPELGRILVPLIRCETASNRYSHFCLLYWVIFEYFQPIVIPYYRLSLGLLNPC